MGCVNNKILPVLTLISIALAVGVIAACEAYYRTAEMTNPNTTTQTGGGYNISRIDLILGNSTNHTVWINYSGYLLNNTITINISNFTGTEGKNLLTLFCNDSDGVQNQSSNSPFTIRIDTQPPNATVNNATGRAVVYYASMTWSGNCTDNGIAGLHTAYTNSTYYTGINGSFSAIARGYFNLTNTSAIPEGNTTVYFFCNDSYGNNKNTSHFKFDFALDSKAPATNTTYTSPSDNIQDRTGAANKTFLGNATDARLDGTLRTPNLTIDGLNYSADPTDGGGYNKSVYLALGAHYYQWTFCDDLWNCNTTEELSYTVYPDPQNQASGNGGGGMYIPPEEPEPEVPLLSSIQAGESAQAGDLFSNPIVWLIIGAVLVGLFLFTPKKR